VGLPVDGERPLSFRALLLFASFPLSLFLFPFPSARHSGDLFLPPESREVSSRRGRLTVEAGEMTLIIPGGFYARYSCLTYRWSEREQLSGLDHPRLMRTFSSSSLGGYTRRYKRESSVRNGKELHEFRIWIWDRMHVDHSSRDLGERVHSSSSSRTILKPSFRARSNTINGDTMAVASSLRRRDINVTPAGCRHV